MVRRWGQLQEFLPIFEGVGIARCRLSHRMDETQPTHSFPFVVEVSESRTSGRPAQCHLPVFALGAWCRDSTTPMATQWTRWQKSNFAFSTKSEGRSYTRSPCGALPVSHGARAVPLLAPLMPFAARADGTIKAKTGFYVLTLCHDPDGIGNEEALVVPGMDVNIVEGCAPFHCVRLYIDGEGNPVVQFDEGGGPAASGLGAVTCVRRAAFGGSLGARRLACCCETAAPLLSPFSLPPLAPLQQEQAQAQSAGGARRVRARCRSAPCLRPVQVRFCP